MINLLTNHDTLRASVMGELTLADMHELEDILRHGFAFEGKMKLLVDVRDMLGLTLDAIWEEFRFTRAYGQDFSHIAIIGTGVWPPLITLFQRLFSDAIIRVFDDSDMAEAWLNEPEQA